MPIIVNIDVVMAQRKMSLGELAEKVDITPRQPVHTENRQSQSRAFFSTLAAICRVLNASPATYSSTYPAKDGEETEDE